MRNATNITSCRNRRYVIKLYLGEHNIPIICSVSVHSIRNICEKLGAMSPVQIVLNCYRGISLPTDNRLDNRVTVFEAESSGGSISHPKRSLRSPTQLKVSEIVS